MAYENRAVQSSTNNSLPTGTDPLVDNTALGDVQAIKILNPTAGSTTPMVGQQAMAASMPVVVASDQTAVPISGTVDVSGTVPISVPGTVPVTVQSGTVAATQSGTWTVQPGNTQNTTPWLVAGTVGVSGTPPIFVSNSATVSVSSLPAIPAGANNIGTVGVSGTPPVFISNNGTVGVSSLPAIPAGTNNIGTVGVSGTPPVFISNNGTVGVSSLPAIPAGTNNIGTVGVSGTPPVFVSNNGTVSVSNFPATQPISGTVGVSSGTVTISGTVPTTIQSGTVVAQLQPVTSGGLSVYRDITAGTAGTAFKASAGQLYGYYFANTGTVTAYFKLYDKASAPGTADTPKLTIPLFGTAAANVEFTQGVAFASGIGIRVTTGAGDTDATTPAGTTAFVNIVYK